MKRKKKKISSNNLRAHTSSFQCRTGDGMYATT